MRVTRTQTGWAVVAGVVAAGLGVAVNLATGSQGNFLAWLAVIVLGPLSGLVSLWAQAGIERDPAKAELDQPKESQTRHDNRHYHTQSNKNRNIKVKATHGNVRINQNTVGGWVFVVQFAILALLSFMVIYLTREDAASGDAHVSNGNVAAEKSQSSTVERYKESQDSELIADKSWPLARGCDGGTTVAMPNGGPPVQSFPVDGDERQRMIDAGGASWQGGSLYVDLSAKKGQELRILNIRPNIKQKQLAPPDWVYSPWGGCGGPSNRVFDLNLDDASLVDRGLMEGTDDFPHGTRTEDIGPAFIVSTVRPATLRFDVSSCRGNYEWRLDITYSIVGHEGSRIRTIGPFRSMGYADDTSSYTLSASGDSYALAGVLDGYSKIC